MRISSDCRDPDLLAAEVRRLQAVNELLSAASKSSHSALLVIDGGFRNALAEIERLRLTDAEREAIAWAISAAENCQHPADDSLRGLLERTRTTDGK